MKPILLSTVAMMLAGCCDDNGYGFAKGCYVLTHGHPYRSKIDYSLRIPDSDWNVNGPALSTQGYPFPAYRKWVE